MKNKERLINIIMAVIISAVMGLLFAYIARHRALPQAVQAMPPAPVMYITSVVESIIVGVIVALVIPMGKLGRGLAAKFNAAPPSMKFNLLNSIPFAVINAIIVSAICSFISIAQAHSHIPAGQAPPLFIMWIGQWLKLLPLSIIVSYVLAIIIAPLVVKAVLPGNKKIGT